ncbi:GATA binding factor [Spraguea lophii 42_110]|uniref:GATA binding factor n=1 Tax=Spraguea lophii (strain 42_110) TaxID=1358809 RepID=S7W5R6_SPRLO|nr:GATA binding factor [Spraguea lophii 42_110]
MENEMHSFINPLLKKNEIRNKENENKVNQDFSIEANNGTYTNTNDYDDGFFYDDIYVHRMENREWRKYAIKEEEIHDYPAFSVEENIMNKGADFNRDNDFVYEKHRSQKFRRDFKYILPEKVEKETIYFNENQHRKINKNIIYDTKPYHFNDYMKKENPYDFNNHNEMRSTQLESKVLGVKLPNNEELGNSKMYFETLTKQFCEKSIPSEDINNKKSKLDEKNKTNKKKSETSNEKPIKRKVGRPKKIKEKPENAVVVPKDIAYTAYYQSRYQPYNYRNVADVEFYYSPDSYVNPTHTSDLKLQGNKHSAPMNKIYNNQFYYDTLQEEAVEPVCDPRKTFSTKPVQVNGKRKTPKNFKFCGMCGIDHTTFWRRANGIKVCNACGLYFKKKGLPRPTRIKIKYNQRARVKTPKKAKKTQ